MRLFHALSQFKLRHSLGLLAFAGAALAVSHTGAAASPGAYTDFDDIIVKIQGKEMQRWSNWQNGDIYGPKECTALGREIAELSNDYRVGAYLDRPFWNSAKAHRKIQEKLQSVPETDPCARWYHALYALESIKSFGYFATDEFYSLYNIATDLYYRERLVPLTPSLRQEWGGLWNTTPQKILGAYHCEESLIYFDSSLRSYNLGAVMAHELEHLVRDKFSYEDHPEVFVRDVATTLLLDEMLSTIHGGFTQLSFRSDNNRDGNRTTGRKVTPLQMDANGFRLFAKRDQKHYRLGGDLNLYKKGGPLQGIWKKLIRTRGFSQGAMFVRFLEAAILPMARGTMDRTELRSVLEIVSGGYFHGQGPSAGAAMDELTRWSEAYPDLVSPLGSLQIKAHHKVSETKTTVDQTFYKTLAERLKKPSRGCLMISEAIRSGQASTYIGAELGAEPEGGEIRTKGGEGARTGGGVRTKGGEGARTGGGIRAKGGEGARTGQPLTPCLNFDEKI